MRTKADSNVHPKNNRKTSNRQKQKATRFDDISDDDGDAVVGEQLPSGSLSTTQSTIQLRASTDMGDMVDPMNTTGSADQDGVDAVVPKSSVWDYAVKLPNGKGKCLKCNREFSCKGHSTTGLRKHLHRCLNLSVFAPDTGRKNARNGNEKSMSAEVKRKFHELVYKCIVQDGRSFGDLRKTGMARLLEEILPGGHLYEFAKTKHV